MRMRFKLVLNSMVALRTIVLGDWPGEGILPNRQESFVDIDTPISSIWSTYKSVGAASCELRFN